VINEHHDTLIPFMMDYIPIIKSVAYLSVLKKRATARKKMEDLRNTGQSFTNEDTACMLTYMLLIHFVVSYYKVEVNDNF